MVTRPVVGEHHPPHGLWGWFLALGVGLLLVGVVAIMAPHVAGLATVLLFGWLLLISGVMHGVAVFQARTWNGAFLELLMAVLALGVGFFFITRTEVTLEILTLFLAVSFFVSGVFRVAASFMMRSANRVYDLLGGGISILLGALIWGKLFSGPGYTGEWIIGTFVGIDLVFQGVALINLALFLRKLATGKPSV